jgi:hypothetical protein
VATTEGHQFNHLYSHPTKRVTGGGAGARTLYTVLADGAGNGEVWAQDIGDEKALPEHSTTKAYDASACAATTGWLDGGLPDVNKRLFHFEVDALMASGSPGLDSGNTIRVEYARRGAAFADAGTLTSASTFPAVLAIAGGYSFKELQVRVTLDRGAASTVPPLLKALKVGYRLRPKQRWRYEVTIDLREESAAFQPDGSYRGRNASQLRTLVDEWTDNDDAGQDDTTVGLAYGGEGNARHPRRRSIAQCELTVQSAESPDFGDGLFRLRFDDITSPSSG